MIKNFVNTWSNFVVNQRWIVLFLTLIFTLAAIYPIFKSVEYQKIQAEKKIQVALEQDNFGEGESFEEETEEQQERRWLYFNNSNEMWFLEDDPTLVEFNLLKERFGNSEDFVIGIEARDEDKNLFNLKTLKLIHELSLFLENHEVVTKVRSLTKYQYTHSDGDSLATDDLIEDMDSLEDNPAVMQGMADVMSKETLALGGLITKDLRNTVISAKPIIIEGSIDHMVKLVNDTKAFIAKQKYEDQGFGIHLYGSPTINERFFTVSQNDFTTTFPLMFLIIILFLIFSFRSISGTLLPFLIIIISVLGIIGMMGYLGIAFNMLNMGIPTVLIAVGIGDSVHIMVDFYQNRSKGIEPKEAAIKATNALWIPCFNTSLTTSLGFMALAVSNLAPLRDYGNIAAIGVFIAFIFSVSTLPAILSFVKGGIKSHERIANTGWVAKITAYLTPFTFNNSKKIAATGLALLVIALISVSQMVTDSNFINYFKESSRVRQDFDYFDRVYKSGGAMAIVLDSGRENGIKEPDFLKEALGFKEYLESFEQTGKVSSFLDSIRNMNQAMHGDDPDYFVIPPSSEHIAQYLILYENGSPDEDLSDVRTLDYRYMRMSVMLKNMSTTNMKKLFDKINQAATDQFPGLRARLTGSYVLHINMNDYIIQGMVKSFSLAVGLIVICFFILFRSFKYGCLAMIPSLFPILFTGGIMVLMEIPVNLTTMIIAAVTFGIVVDDSIHIISRYIRARHDRKTRKEALHLSLTESGRAVTFTSIILFFGFSVRMLSEMTVNIHFGMFAAIIILMALLSDLVILPAIMFLTGDKAAYPGEPNSEKI
ncbi:MAG: MMPL family transporter [Proteobacteria bacterium]|nr:MMPL family transporter [Pseudomonadota bacterium]